MKKKRFRILLFVYFLIVIAGGIVSFSDDRVLPSDIIQRADNATYLLMDGTPFAIQIVIASMIGLTLLLSVIGGFGMLFFWGKARYLFAFSVGLKILLSMSQKWSVCSCYTGFLGGIELLFDGMLIALVFWGTAQPLFKTAKTEDSHLSNGN